MQLQIFQPFMRRLLCASVLVIASAAWAADVPPPREVHLEEKQWEQLSNRDLDPMGQKALAFSPGKWRHAETGNFILHYRRVTEAQKVAREIEYDLWFVAHTLGATKDQYTKKSHVFIFQDEKEWSQFVADVADSGVESWSASFAHGDELFLHVGGIGEPFDSQMLAHETTHAVVARLYPNKYWPLWMNEGFAEYEGYASVAARKGQWLKGYERDLPEADLPLDELLAMKQYPAEREKVTELYQTGEKLIRFLMTDFPKDRIAKFVDVILNGGTLETAVTQIYGDQVPDFATFKSRFAHFRK